MQVTPVSTLTPSEVTRELLDLAMSAPEYERRLCLHSILGALSPVSDSETRAELRRLIEAMPAHERRVQLVLWRRWCGLGLKQYGALDPLRDRRDWLAEQVAEAVDGVMYAVAPMTVGQGSEANADAWYGLARRLVVEALEKESV
jgi:hypothetical protein